MKIATPLSLVLLLLFIAVSGYAWSHREEIVSPCLPPLHYTVGTVDPQFGITREEFVVLVDKATSAWEKALGKDLFVSDPDAPLTVNLVYDERQSKTQEGTRLEKEIASQKTSYDDLTKKLDTTKQSYNQLSAQHAELLKRYQEDLARYQEKVSAWNEKGGAPKDVYDALEKERASLEEERSTINTLVGKINALAGASQKIANTANAAADTINEKVARHNTLFEDASVFDKGRFNGKNITVYQFTSSGDLLLALVHEFGHALNIEHTQDPRSVMYYLLQSQPTDPVTLTQDDLSAAKTACRFDIQTPQDYFRFFISSLSSAFNRQKAN